MANSFTIPTMAPAGKKRFEVDERMLIQQAEQTIKRDPVLALVELITNSDDSYWKMEDRGIPITGDITTHVASRRRDSSIYDVFDNAMGMNGEEMIRRVTIIGGDESGLTEESGGRSFFGRGLKECMIAFGKAEVRSIKDNQHYKCSSFGVHVDREAETKEANPGDYRQLNIPAGNNGTRVRLFSVNKKLRGTPQFRNLGQSLSLHYSLRDILSNPNRNVVLRYGSINVRGMWEIKDEKKLCYSPPEGEVILEKALAIDGYPSAEAVLKVYKAKEEIPQSAERYEDERGFLICSKRAIHDVYHFGFANHEAAGLIFGRVTCYYLDHLLRTEKDAAWINASRDGMRWSHDFCKALEKAVVNELRPIYRKESENRTAVKRSYENEETKRRVQKALELFNEVAMEELDDTSGAAKGIEEGEKPVGPCPPIPGKEKVLKRVPNGFAFTPPFVRMDVSQSRTVTIKAELFGEITEDSVVTLSSDNQAIKIEDGLLHIAHFLKSKKVMQDNGEGIGIVTMRTRLSCDEVGVEGKISAKCGSREAILEVIVTEQQKSGGGLFADIKFDPDAVPEQRVLYIRGEGIIRIATRAPSVANYFGLNGERQSEPEAKSLLAELILDACCAELVRLRFAQEGFFFIDDEPASISEMFQYEVSQYKNRLADRLHKIIAEK